MKNARIIEADFKHSYYATPIHEVRIVKLVVKSCKIISQIHNRIQKKIDI